MLVVQQRTGLFIHPVSNLGLILGLTIQDRVVAACCGFRRGGRDCVIIGRCGIISGVGQPLFVCSEAEDGQHIAATLVVVEVFSTCYRS